MDTRPSIDSPSIPSMPSSSASSSRELLHGHAPHPPHHATHGGDAAVPFPILTPILSARSLRADGFENFPPPLPADPVDLERMLTSDPDLVRQMAVTDADIGPPPEGGREAWLCVATAFFVLFCVFGFVLASSNRTTWTTSCQTTQSRPSRSIQSTLTFLASILFGRLFDAYGARPLVIAGTTISVVSLVCVAFCKEFYQFLLAHALFGISGSILYSPGTAVAGHWFMRKRSTAVGIVVCGSGLGGVIYPIMLKQLLGQLVFRDAILIIAGMNAVLMLPAWFFMKGRLPPRSPPPLRALKGPWKDTRYVFLVVGAAFIMLNFFSPYFNAITLAQSSHVRPDIAAYAIGILQAGSFVGRGTAGPFADRYGVWPVWGTSGFAMAASLFAFWVGTPLGTAATIVGLLLFGYASGAWLTLVSATIGAISPTREFGMRLGMMWSFVSIPILVGPVVCSVLIGAAGNRFTYAGIFCGVTMLVGQSLAHAPQFADAMRARRQQAARDHECDCEKAQP